jgi:hypothetical protein
MLQEKGALKKSDIKDTLLKGPSFNVRTLMTAVIDVSTEEF